MIARKMCASCPFNPTSVFYSKRDDWGVALDNEMFADVTPVDGSIAHGCHEIEDCGKTTDRDIQCIGHLDWLKGIKHA